MEADALKAHLLACLKPMMEALVDFPEALVIEFNNSTRVMFISIGSDPKDRGKLIGREGRMAHSLRVIVNAICSRFNFRSVIEIVED